MTTKNKKNSTGRKSAEYERGALSQAQNWKYTSRVGSSQMFENKGYQNFLKHNSTVWKQLAKNKVKWSISDQNQMLERAKSAGSKDKLQRQKVNEKSASILLGRPQICAISQSTKSLKSNSCSDQRQSSQHTANSRSINRFKSTKSLKSSSKFGTKRFSMPQIEKCRISAEDPQHAVLKRATVANEEGAVRVGEFSKLADVRHANQEQQLQQTTFDLEKQLLRHYELMAAKNQSQNYSQMNHMRKQNHSVVNSAKRITPAPLKSYSSSSRLNDSNVAIKLLDQKKMEKSGQILGRKAADKGAVNLAKLKTLTAHDTKINLITPGGRTNGSRDDKKQQSSYLSMLKRPTTANGKTTKYIKQKQKVSPNFSMLNQHQTIQHHSRSQLTGPETHEQQIQQQLLKPNGSANLLNQPQMPSQSRFGPQKQNAPPNNNTVIDNKVQAIRQKNQQQQQNVSQGQTLLHKNLRMREIDLENSFLRAARLMNENMNSQTELNNGQQILNNQNDGGMPYSNCQSDGHLLNNDNFTLNESKPYNQMIQYQNSTGQRQGTFDSRKFKNGILLGAGEAHGSSAGGFQNQQHTLSGIIRTTQTSRKDLTTDSSYNNLHLPPQQPQILPQQASQNDLQSMQPGPQQQPLQHQSQNFANQIKSTHEFLNSNNVGSHQMSNAIYQQQSSSLVPILNLKNQQMQQQQQQQMPTTSTIYTDHSNHIKSGYSQQQQPSSVYQNHNGRSNQSARPQQHVDGQAPMQQQQELNQDSGAANPQLKFKYNELCHLVDQNILSHLLNQIPQLQQMEQQQNHESNVNRSCDYAREQIEEPGIKHYKPYDSNGLAQKPARSALTESSLGDYNQIQSRGEPSQPHLDARLRQIEQLRMLQSFNNQNMMGESRQIQTKGPVDQNRLSSIRSTSSATKMGPMYNHMGKVPGHNQSHDSGAKSSVQTTMPSSMLNSYRVVQNNNQRINYFQNANKNAHHPVVVGQAPPQQMQNNADAKLSVADLMSMHRQKQLLAQKSLNQQMNGPHILKQVQGVPIQQQQMFESYSVNPNYGINVAEPTRTRGHHRQHTANTHSLQREPYLRGMQQQFQQQYNTNY